MDGVKVFGLATLSIPLFVIATHRYYYSKDKQMKMKKSEQVQLEEEEEEQVIINLSSKDKQQQQQKKKKSEQQVITNNVPWSELVPDLLGEIVSRLCLTDQARFLLVCKNWSKVTTKSSSSSLPWLGRIIPGTPTQYQNFDPLAWLGRIIPCSPTQFLIFDPLSSTPNHPASIQNIWWSNLGFPSPPPSPVGIGCNQHNWLLLSFQKPRLFTHLSRRYFIMFSPLTKKVITLPGFDYPRGMKLFGTFSTQPHSPDCVYCLIDAYYNDKISVITYHNGDKEWTARQFNKVPGFRSCTFHPLILDGIIYFVSCFGQVASYNILSGEFNFDCLSVDTLQNDGLHRRWKLFVLNEEPMILYYDPDGTKDVTHPQCIKRYDRSSKVWIPATTLLGYTLVFSQKIFNVSLINTKGRRNNGVLSNKIYHFVNGGCRVYSLENGNLVRFKSTNSNLLEDGGGELPEYKYNFDGILDTDVNSVYWLKPPCVRSSSDRQSSNVIADDQGPVAVISTLFWQKCTAYWLLQYCLVSDSQFIAQE